MDSFMLLILVVSVVVLCSFYGGSKVPKIIRENNKVLLGFLVGMIFAHFTKDFNIEGMSVNDMFMNCQTSVESGKQGFPSRNCYLRDHYLSCMVSTCSNNKDSCSDFNGGTWHDWLINQFSDDSCNATQETQKVNRINSILEN